MIFLALIADATVAVTLGFFIGRYSMKVKIDSIQAVLRNYADDLSTISHEDWARFQGVMQRIRKIF